MYGGNRETPQFSTQVQCLLYTPQRFLLKTCDTFQAHKYTHTLTHTQAHSYTHTHTLTHTLKIKINVTAMSKSN